MSNVYLAHHGIANQKWGHRRFQNPDGSLTPAGRERYGVGPERASKKYSKAGMVGLEAKYQAKRAVKSAKKMASDLSQQRKESVSASKQRRRKAKVERAERKEQIRKEEAEELARKIAARESKKSLAELKDEFDKARLSDARKRVERLQDKRDRIREKAFLKEQEKALKKEMKKAKKDAEKEARKRFSKKTIATLSDEELKARVTRLETEIKLASLEAQRDAPKTTAAAKWVSEWAGRGVSEGATKLAGTAAVKVGKKALGLTDEDINEFVRLTKKK